MKYTIYRRKAIMLFLKIYQSTAPIFNTLRYLAPSYYRGKLSAAAYSRHYNTALKLYIEDGNQFLPKISSIYDIGAHLLYSPDRSTPFTIDNKYMDLVDKVSLAVNVQFRQPTNCYFFPRLTSPILPGQCTDDLQDIKNGNVITVQLREYNGIKGLTEMCSAIIASLERNVYGSYLIADKIYIYRSVVSKQSEQISWLWHYDNHPNEILKVMVYLTDVGKNNGPFEYLLNPVTGKSIKMKPIPNLVRPFIETRINPQQIQKYARAGYTPFKMLGKKGTTCLFSENIIHRATIANERYRDVVVIQVRPVTFRPTSCISNKWTGSFQHVDVNRDPDLLQPVSKPNMASG